MRKANHIILICRLISCLIQCNHHHSIIFHYCPSAVNECGCTCSNPEAIEEPENSLTKLGGHVSICSDHQGYVYLVSGCNNDDRNKSDRDAIQTTSDFDPSCETFKLIKRSRNDIVHIRTKDDVISGAMVIVVKDDLTNSNAPSNECDKSYLLRFGGWIVSSPTEHKSTVCRSNQPKNIYSYVYCVYDLQEYHESTDKSNGVSSRGWSGHSKIITELVSLNEPPLFNSDWEVYDLQTKMWLNDDPFLKECCNLKLSSSLPFSTGDSATVCIGQSLYVIGGYTIEHDKDQDRQGLMYQVSNFV